MARTKRKTNPVIQAAEAPAQAQKQYRAAAYARLSVEDSGNPGADTIEGQKALLLRFIEDDPTLTLYGLFCDNGRTGTDFDRPQFEKMMEEVRKGHIDCIVVKDLSRFGRNYKETGNYLERIFPFLGVRFIAVNDGFDTLTAQRGADGYLVPLKNLINEVYSKDISRKSGSALAAKQKNGDFIVMSRWARRSIPCCRSTTSNGSPSRRSRATSARSCIPAKSRRCASPCARAMRWRPPTLTATSTVSGKNNSHIERKPLHIRAERCSCFQNGPIKNSEW